MSWVYVAVVVEQACPGSGAPGDSPVALPPSPPILTEPPQSTGKEIGWLRGDQKCVRMCRGERTMDAAWGEDRVSGSW